MKKLTKKQLKKLCIEVIDWYHIGMPIKDIVDKIKNLV